MKTPGFSILSFLLAFTARLRFPQLFLLTGALFLLDLVIPDVIPLADELLLGLVTALFASIRKKKPDAATGENK